MTEKKNKILCVKCDLFRLFGCGYFKYKNIDNPTEHISGKKTKEEGVLYLDIVNEHFHNRITPRAYDFPGSSTDNNDRKKCGLNETFDCPVFIPKKPENKQGLISRIRRWINRG